MLEDNKQVVLDCTEAANRHDATAIERFYVEDAVYYGVEGEVRGRDNIKANIQRYLTAVRGLKFTIKDIFGEGDRVFSRTRLQGHEHGQFRRGATHGKRLDLRWVMNAARFEAGKIVEEWGICNQLEILRQLGLMQTPVTSGRA